MTYANIERELRRRILTAQYKAGERIPPERMLTTELGCSRGTISKALSALEKEGIIERRHGAGTFVAEGSVLARPGPAGAVNFKNRGNIIKYLSPAEDTRVVNSRNWVLDGMHEVLDDAGFHVSIDFYNNAKECAECLAKLCNAQIAGLVLWPTPGGKVVEQTRKLIESGVPVVMIDTHLQEVECDYVVSDNITGAAEMVRFLAGTGHRNICYFTSEPDRSSLVDRMAGFLKGMVMAGLPFAADNIVQVDGDLENVLASVLRRRNKPDAIFASHDVKAIAIINLLLSRGIRVPEDISVVGYDGVDFGGMVNPPLTTMEQDFRGMAVKASRILLERLDRRAGGLFYRLYVRPKMKTRKSNKEICS